MRKYYLHISLALATGAKYLVQFLYRIRLLFAILFFALFLVLFDRLGLPSLLVIIISYILAAVVFLILYLVLSFSKEGLLNLKVKTKRNLQLQYFSLRKPFRLPFILYLRPFNLDHSGLNILEDPRGYNIDVATKPDYYYKGRPKYFESKNFFDKTVIDLFRPWGDTLALISNADYKEANTIITMDENWEAVFRYLSEHARFILCTPMHLLTLKNETEISETAWYRSLSKWPGTDTTSYQGFVKELNFLYTEKLLHKTILVFPAFEFGQHYDTINEACSAFNFVLPEKEAIKNPESFFSLAEWSHSEYLKDSIVVIKVNNEAAAGKSGLLLKAVDWADRKPNRKKLAAYLGQLCENPA